MNAAGDVPQYPNESPLDAYLQRCDELPDISILSDGGMEVDLPLLLSSEPTPPNDGPADLLKSGQLARQTLAADDPWKPIEAYIARRLRIQDEQIPPFEKNDATLALMSHYVHRNVMRDLAAVQLRQYYGQLEDQLTDSGMARFFRLVDESLAGSSTPVLERLSKQGTSYLTALVDLALRLQLGNVRESSYQLALTDLACHRQDVQSRKAKHDAQLTALETLREKLAQQEAQAQDICTTLRRQAPEEQALTQQYKAQAQLMSAKQEEYQRRLAAIISDQDARLGGIRLQPLQALQDQLHAQQQRFDKSRSLLQSYRDLPPDLTLAKLKLNEAQHRLQMLRIEKDNLLSAMARDMIRVQTTSSSPALTSFDIPQDATTYAKLKPLTEHKVYSLQECFDRADYPRLSLVSSRDFIDNSLYNPHYGYFSKQATIFEMPDRVDFGQFKSTLEFMDFVADEYAKVEAAAENEADDAFTRQVWHTPTELFKPHYGNAIARYLVHQHRQRAEVDGEGDLVVYEIGGGNGTLALNILDYLRTAEPELYRRARYRIVEISASLAAKQRQRLQAGGHGDRAQVLNKSVFAFDSTVSEPCFVLALEVADNFAHDVLRFDQTSATPLEAMVRANELNDFSEEYRPVVDPLLARYLFVEALSGQQPKGRLPLPLRKAASLLPFAANMSRREFVPTRLLQFFEVLKRHFPRHKLVLSDFFRLPDAVKGNNGPVVQTRYEKTMVPVSTYMVLPGFFDIFFPTDFTLASSMHRIVMTPDYSLPRVQRAAFERLARTADYAKFGMDAPTADDTHVDSEKPSTGFFSDPKVATHKDFMTQWADLPATRTKSRENPLVMYYENVKFLLT
ncbi:hypothetical protein RI367_004814 [Sorochytrium milnesiophthora]